MKIDFSSLTNITRNDLFVIACSSGDLATVKTLLTTDEYVRCALSNKQVAARVNIAYGDNIGLIKACAGGHIDVVEYLLTTKDFNKHAKINAKNGEPLYQALKNNHKDVIDFLLTSKQLHPKQRAYVQSRHVIESMKNLDLFHYLLDTVEISNQIDILEGYHDYFKAAARINNPEILKRLLNISGAPDVHFEEYILLRTACTAGNLETVKYILNEAPTQIVVNLFNKQTNDEIFGCACRSGNTQLLEYLLVSNQLKTLLTITTESIYGFIVAAENGDKDMVKFLACSDSIPVNIDWHANNDMFFDNMYKRRNEKMLTYAITELGFKSNDLIKKFLDQQNNDFANYIKHTFDTMELKEGLETTLPTTMPVVAKRVKV